MASLGMPSKRGREESGAGTSHPTIPPRRELQTKATMGKAMAVLAVADELSPPLKKTKLQYRRKQALFATELDTEWQKVYDHLVFKLKTAGPAIEALEQLLKIEKEDATAREEKFERKIEELQELLKDSEEVVMVFPGRSIYLCVLCSCLGPFTISCVGLLASFPL